MCLPSLFPPNSPAPFSSLPVVFSVWLPFAKPFPPASAAYHASQEFKISLLLAGLQLVFICHYFCKAIIKIICQTLGEICAVNRMEITQLGSVPTEPPSQGKREVSQWEAENLSYFTCSPSAYFQRALPCIASSHVSFWYSHFPPHILFYLHIKAVCGASSFWAVITVAGELTPQASICCFDHGF